MGTEVLEDFVLLSYSSTRKPTLRSYLLICVTYFLCLLLAYYLVYSLTIRYNSYYKKISYDNVPEFWIKRAVIYNNISLNKNINNSNIVKIKSNLNFIDKYKLICYYNFPSETNITINKLIPANIDPFLCTHINVCFGTIINSTIVITNDQERFIMSLVDLKKVNPNLKIIFSIGGADNNNDDGFPNMVLNHQNRKKFIQSVDKLIREYKLDGIDLDWEFPDKHENGDKRQKIHFTQLLQEIRRNIDKQIKHKYLLSVAVAAPYFLALASYDIPRINQFVDYINLMSYDFYFYTKATPFTGINSPLYSAPTDIGYFSTLNINYSAYYWHFNGMEKNKIMVGLPTYGHSYTLLNEKNTGIKAPAKGYGQLGYEGFVDYKQTCTFITDNNIKPIFDMDTKSPYAFHSTEWISYDDSKSLTYKTEFIKNNDFGGAMIYSLNMDDHLGLCKKDNAFIKFPLTNTIKSVLYG